MIGFSVGCFLQLIWIAFSGTRVDSVVCSPALSFEPGAHVDVVVCVLSHVEHDQFEQDELMLTVLTGAHVDWRGKKALGYINLDFLACFIHVEYQHFQPYDTATAADPSLVNA